MQEKQATLARIVPTIALALAESKIVSKYTYTDLEYFSCAAAPLKVGFWKSHLLEKIDAYKQVAICC